MVRRMRNAKVGHIASLHALRGIAALGVVALHLSEATPGLPVRAYTDLIANMFYAVDLFFILSGVVMAAVYGHMFEASVSARDCAVFLIARVARIWPMLAIASVLALLASLASQQAGTVIASSGGLTASFLAEFFGLSGWFDWAWLNPPSWSLSAEFAVYLATPFLILAFKRASLRLSLAMLVILPLAPGLLYGLATSHFLQHPLGAELPLGYFLVAPEATWFWNMKGPFIIMRALSMFLCGLALFRIARSGHLERWSGPASLAIVLALLLAGLHLGIPRLLVFLLMIALVACALGGRMRNHRIFAKPLLYRLGEISLGVYLIHWPLIELTRAAWATLGTSPISEAGPLLSLAFIVMTGAIIIACANLFYTLFEVPARRGIRKGGQRLLGKGNGSPLLARAGMRRTIVTAALSTAIVFLCIPAGILSQGFLVRAPDAAQTPSILRVDQLPSGAAIIFDHTAPLPVRVRNSDTAYAYLGPHGRNATVLAPGMPLEIMVEERPDLSVPARIAIQAGRNHAVVEVSSRHSP